MYRGIFQSENQAAMAEEEIMKKKMLLALVLAGAFCLAGCGGDTGNNGSEPNFKRPPGTQIVIYAGGSSEFSWTKGSEEDEVIEAVEQKYYEDTGKSLDFQVSYLGQDMKQRLASEIAGGTQVDVAISHTRGGDGIDDWMMQQRAYLDLSDYLDALAPNLKAAIDKSTIEGAVSTPLDSMTTYTDEVIGIPSVINPYKFGILVRKDWMEACGYTDDPAMAETEFGAGKNYILVDNLETFKEMCLAINKYTGNAYTVTGASWDWEKVLFTGAYSNAGYFTEALFDVDGTPTIMAGVASDEYFDILNTEYEWVQAGVTNRDGQETSIENGESEFIGGRTGVFIQDPTIEHLIRIARLTKQENPEAEFTVFGALPAEKGGTKKGFMRNMEATFAACILNTSPNAAAIMSFLNWVYSSEENYNLCRYGVEGVHWIDNGDGTYSYPEGKAYDMYPAYSGILTLVENQNMSDLVYKGYTEEELRWLNDVAGNPENYLENEVVDYLFVLTDEDRSAKSNSLSKIWGTVNGTWKGSVTPNENQWATDVAAYRSSMAGVHTKYTSQFNIMKAKRTAEQE